MIPSRTYISVRNNLKLILPCSLETIEEEREEESKKGNAYAGKHSGGLWLRGTGLPQDSQQQTAAGQDLAIRACNGGPGWSATKQFEKAQFRTHASFKAKPVIWGLCSIFGQRTQS